MDVSVVRRTANWIALWIVVFAAIGAIAAAIVHLYTQADEARHVQTALDQIADTHLSELSLIEAKIEHPKEIATTQSWPRALEERLRYLRVLGSLKRTPDLSRLLTADHTYEQLAEQAWSALIAGDVAQAQRIELQMTGAPLDELQSADDAVDVRIDKAANRTTGWADAGTVGILFSGAAAALLLHMRVSGGKRKDKQVFAAAIEEQDKWLSSLLRASNDMITVTDPLGNVIFSSPAVEHLLGWTNEQVMGRSSWEMIHPDDLQHVAESLLRLGAHDGDYECDEFRVLAADGSWHWVEATGRYIDNDPTQIVINYRLIDERKEYERQLLDHALHDPLTHLANRALLLNRIEHALLRRSSASDPATLALLDLDDFKTLNDGLGHAAGDELLRAVADRLSVAFRPEDTVGRLGGDEFVILSERFSQEPTLLGERVITALAEPFVVAGTFIHVHASIGIAKGTSDMTKPEDLLRAADVAMYTAKREGKNCFRLFSEALKLEAIHLAQVVADIETGLERGEFSVAYQPIVSLEDGLTRGAEALIRWTHPDKGSISPADFINVAEESGTIVQLGSFVLDAACTWLHDAAPMLPADFKMHVNVSVRQLYDHDFHHQVAAIVGKHDIPIESLVLEVTETALIRNLAAVRSSLGALRELGAHIGIDDFGTGFSSLAHLREFPVDVLKIDSSFITNMKPGPRGAPITDAILRIGSAMGYEVVAEGIEKPEQRRQLTRLGCRLGQGYLFAHPMPGDALVKLLQRDITLAASRRRRTPARCPA